jgi:glutamine---fructose-6-phosphate transaminase (isomerizing)
VKGRGRKMKRCKKCIMPETAKGITLDENGLCQLCREHKEFVPKGEEALRKEISEYLRETSEYDCIVAVSGGRDSSYALYYAKQVLGLKPVAVHNDNDFETDTANRNLESITRSMDVPLIRMSSQKRVSKKIVAEKFKMNSHFGPWLVVDETCEACEYGFHSAAYNEARKRGVQLIIWGDSADESTKPYHSLFQHNKVPTKWDRLFRRGMVNVVKYKLLFDQMKREYGRRDPEGLKEIRLYDYIRWDRRIIVDTIEEKMGWSAPADSPTTWRVDCSLVPLVNYLTEKAYGVSKIEIGFSNMIRNGKMDRTEALKQVEKIKANTDPKAFKSFLMEMGVSESAINRVL